MSSVASSTSTTALPDFTSLRLPLKLHSASIQNSALAQQADFYWSRPASHPLDPEPFVPAADIHRNAALRVSGPFRPRSVRESASSSSSPRSRTRLPEPLAGDAPRAPSASEQPSSVRHGGYPSWLVCVTWEARLTSAAAFQRRRGPTHGENEQRSEAGASATCRWSSETRRWPSVSHSTRQRVWSPSLTSEPVVDPVAALP
jgi:hypothetical protein